MKVKSGKARINKKAFGITIYILAWQFVAKAEPDKTADVCS